MASPDPTSADIAPPLQGGRLHLIRVLGEGGVGTVYLARDDHLGVLRAVKVLSQERCRFEAQRRRFDDEARIQATLQHPNVVHVFEILEEEDRVCFVMEWVPGGSLWERIQTSGPLTPREAASAMTGVLSALEAAHALGIVHRDIKPHNILLAPGNVPKLADFGVAHHSLDGAADLTRTGVVMGTWSFMAPEQRASSRRVDPRSDVYAAGSTLYTLLTRRMEQNLFDLDAKDPAFAGIPPPLAAIVVKATRYAREDRYPSASAMRADLEALLGEMPAEPVAEAEGAPATDETADSVFRAPMDPARLPTPVPPGPAGGDRPDPRPRTDPGQPAGAVVWSLDDERSTPRTPPMRPAGARSLAVIAVLFVLAGIAVVGWVLADHEPEAPAALQRTVAVPAAAPPPAARTAPEPTAPPAPTPIPVAAVETAPGPATREPVRADPEPVALPPPAPDTPPSTGDPTEVVRWVAERHPDDVYACHARFLADDAEVRGTVAVVWTVAGGAVTSAAVLANTTGLADLGRCLADASAGWPFPEGFAGEGLSYTFRLDPARTAGWEVGRAAAGRAADLRVCRGGTSSRQGSPVVLVLAVEGGRVGEATVRDAGSGPARVATCLARKAASWSFPAWVGGTWIVPVGP